jgi:autotransporter-associated beta strand protein
VQFRSSAETPVAGRRPGSHYAVANRSGGCATLIRGLHRALLGSTVLVAASPVLAQDATWLTSPGSNDLLAGTNWSTGITPGSGNTATLGASDTTALTVSSSWQVGGITLSPGAPLYTIDTTGMPVTFDGSGFGVNGGALTLNITRSANNRGVSFTGSATADSITINVSGGGGPVDALQFRGSSSAGSATINIGGRSRLFFYDSSTAANATISNSGLLWFNGSATADHATISNSGDLQVHNSATAGNAVITNVSGRHLTFTDTGTAGNATIDNSGDLQVTGSATAGNATITTRSGGVTTFLQTSSGGTSRHIIEAGGSVDVSALPGGTITLGSIEDAGTVAIGANSLTVGSNNLSTTFSGDLAGTVARFIKSGTGTLTLTGTSHTYGGDTTIDGGALVVNGSLTNSSGIVVNNTGTLGGTGTVSGVTVNNGGTLAPGSGTAGSALAIDGNLALQSGAIYLVQVNPATASLANVTGAAALGGATVNANFANGTYVARQYTILTAGSVSGTFNPAVANTNLPSGFRTALSYDATHAYLDLALSFAPPSGNLNGNQQGVGNAIVNHFNTNGSIPLVFGGLTPAGLTQLSGEGATGSQQTTFNAMTQFMGVLIDPFVAGRDDPLATGGNAAYAAEAMAYAGKRNPSDALAAIHAKAPLRTDAALQRWSVWAAGFGGSQTTDGSAVLGSNNTRSSIYGVAAGVDYRLSPSTLAGFALAGGGSSFSVSGSGGGRSDLFQAGAFLRHDIGAAYLTGALAYGWQDVTTDRTVTVAGRDQLRARFNADAWSGRLEGGYRFVRQGVGLTPYAAVQATGFALPAYAETVVAGANTFALNYGAKTATATRGELGLRGDKSLAMQDGVFTLRGRLAWAHDNNDRSVGATFQTLPGASFVVSGAQQPRDLALTAASAEWKWLHGWSAVASFEGEFSAISRGYAGKGILRRAW